MTTDLPEHTATPLVWGADPLTGDLTTDWATNRHNARVGDSTIPSLSIWADRYRAFRGRRGEGDLTGRLFSFSVLSLPEVWLGAFVLAAGMVTFCEAISGKLAIAFQSLTF